MNGYGFWLAAVAAAICPLAAPAAAAPTAALQTAPKQVAYIPFDPPLGETLRYRFETVEEQDGQVQTRWSVSAIRFEAAEDGYRMVVSPMTHGVDGADRITAALIESVADLAARPYAVRLGADGSILALEDEEAWWSALFGGFEAAITSLDAEPALAEALGRVLTAYRAMPAAARLDFLFQELQPLVEFGETETTAGAPVSGTIAGESPFGGTINREYHLTLDRVAGDVAHLSAWITVPRAEIEALSANVLQGLTDAAPADAERLRGALAGLKSFTHETRATYQVSVPSGLTLAFRSTETIEAMDGDRSFRKRTVTTVQALD